MAIKILRNTELIVSGLGCENVQALYSNACKNYSRKELTINLEDSYILLSGTSKLVLILKAKDKLAFSPPSLCNGEFELQQVLGFCIVGE